VLRARFPGVQFSFIPADIVSQILNFGLPAPIDVQIVGRNFDANRQFAAKLVAKLDRCRASSTCASTRLQPAVAAVDVDRTRAAQSGYTQRDVANNLLISLSGSARRRRRSGSTRRPGSATPWRR
jgi:multidrug efflux pump subunit AcrB